ncbi:MAG: hypothetical protein ACK4GC_05800, partial [Paracoccaceae bacterium]
MMILGSSASARAMPMPAGDLMRVAVGIRRVQADKVQQFGQPRLTRALGDDVGKHFQAFLSDAATGKLRVERAVGILKDHLYVAVQLTHFGWWQVAALIRLWHPNLGTSVAPFVIAAGAGPNFQARAWVWARPESHWRNTT